MITSVLASMVCGAFLGHIFKWPILLPTYGAAIVLYLSGYSHEQTTVLALVGELVAVAVALQIGYVFGLVVVAWRRTRPGVDMAAGKPGHMAPLAQGRSRAFSGRSEAGTPADAFQCAPPRIAPH